MLHFFSSLGNVLDSRGCCTTTTFQHGYCNWFALQYENDLLAKKAVCHSGTTPLLGNNSNSSTSSIYCGVKHLNDDDPIVTQKKTNWTTTATQSKATTSPLWKRNGENIADSSAAAAAGNVLLLDKNSILLSATDQRAATLLPPPLLHEQRKRHRNTCEQFLRWILLIHD
jgi:hypothetical protein